MAAHERFLWGMNSIFICNDNLRTVYVGCAITQVVSCWPVTPEAWVQYQVSLCEICGVKSGTWKGFSPNSSVFSCQYHSTNAPYSFSCTFYSYQKDKWVGPTRGRGSRYKLVGPSSLEVGLVSDYVAYFFVFLGSISISHLYRLTLPDQARVTL